ncbi:MAG TPA: hypothetical protein PKE21_00400 [Flavobacteriales bacterium]|nr:hypothetical protein [Flavobacteriales bacterium]HMR25912.1 hypothetical protein [Flavobacteriales bacterium]
MRSPALSVALLCLLGTSPVRSQSFETRWGAAGSLGLGAVAQAPGMVVGVSALNADQERTAILVSMNGTGQVTGSVPLPLAGRVFGQAFVPAAGGGGYLVGSIIPDGGDDHDLLVVRITAQNAVQWVLTEAAPYDQQVMDAAEGGGAGLYITGIDNTSGSHDVLLGRVTTAGALLWTTVEGGPLDEEGLGVAGDANGALVTGRQMNFSGESDALHIGMDATGNVLWASSWGGVANDVGRALIRRSNGTYVMAGTTGSYGITDQLGRRKDHVWLMALESDGDTLWTRAIGDTVDARGAFALVEAVNGDLLVAGEVGLGHSTDAMLIRRTPLGAPIWERRYDAGQEEQLTGIREDPSGIWAVGRSFDASGLQLLVVRKNGQGL